LARICIVAHFAFGALQGGGTGHVGGVERQTTMLARWLAKRGHEVSLLTWNDGQPEDTVIDGVRVIPMCGRSEGIPGLRFLTPRWTSLLKAVRKADADLYYFNAAEAATGQLAMWCRRNGRKFVYSVANDLECTRSLPRIKAPQARLLYVHGVRHADVVISQTDKQKRMLSLEFGRDSVVLPMPCAGPDDSEVTKANGRGGNRVLWAARLDPVKRFDVLLDVARQNPQLIFDVAAPIVWSRAYTESMLRDAAAIPNVVMHGRVAPERMPDLYRHSTVLCCTSDSEGFPNTFLEAWSWGVPVVSTVDPDGIIERNQLGLFVTKEKLSNALKDLCGDTERHRRLCRNARDYYVRNHQVDTAMSRFEQLFLQTIGKRERA